MRIRAMRAGDRPGVIAVYEARAGASTGLMGRNPFYWRRQWPRRNSKNIWLVATDRGRIEGVAAGRFDPDSAWSLEAHWLPECDGTGVGDRLIRSLIRRIERRDPIAIGAWVVDGSPALPLYARIVGHRRPSGSVFMAGAVDARALLRDAARVVERRLRNRLRLRAGPHEIVTAGKGRPVATISSDPNILLGILLGIRGFQDELRRGTLRLQPRSQAALEASRAAFPSRRFFISDAW